MTTTNAIAIDLGAQSGRVAVGSFDGERLDVTEVHRFANVPVHAGDRLHWDVLALHAETLSGLSAARRATRGPLETISVDAWGLDFALLDRAGRLVQNPVHHRDGRTATAMAEAHARVPAREIYELTGIQMMAVNTLYQLWAMAEEADPALDAADALVMIPDLFHRWLCGVSVCELTAASTTQCVDPRTESWSWELLERLGLPARLFGELVRPGTILGPLEPAVADATGIRDASVVAGAGHDTASAVAAVPFQRADSAYISSGTWSLVGLELAGPRIDDRTFGANLTNERGVEGTFRLLRNVTGLWLLHECRRSWAQQGDARGYDELAEMAEGAPRLRSLVDPNDPVFLAPGNMPERIRAYCAATGQPPPEQAPAVVRCVLESLALKYRHTIELLSAASATRVREIHIVGGGAHNRRLCQWTADATGLPVTAGPAEATSIGNILVQLIAAGELESLAQARELVRRSFPQTVYAPRGGAAWDEAYGRFSALPPDLRQRA